jgi:hypothetical protein
MKFEIIAEKNHMYLHVHIMDFSPFMRLPMDSPLSMHNLDVFNYYYNSVQTLHQSSMPVTTLPSFAM